MTYGATTETRLHRDLHATILFVSAICINIAILRITWLSSPSLRSAAGTIVTCHYRFGFLSMTANTIIAHP